MPRPPRSRSLTRLRAVRAAVLAHGYSQIIRLILLSGQGGRCEHWQRCAHIPVCLRCIILLFVGRTATAAGFVRSVWHFSLRVPGSTGEERAEDVQRPDRSWNLAARREEKLLYGHVLCCKYTQEMHNYAFNPGQHSWTTGVRGVCVGFHW